MSLDAMDQAGVELHAAADHGLAMLALAAERASWADGVAER